MASSSNLRNYSSESEDELMAAIDDYKPEKPDRGEILEKSLTNLNTNISIMARQHEELTKSFQEFSINFNKQQELLYEEIQSLRVEASKIRKLKA